MMYSFEQVYREHNDDIKISSVESTDLLRCCCLADDYETILII